MTKRSRLILVLTMLLAFLVGSTSVVQAKRYRRRAKLAISRATSLKITKRRWVKRSIRNRRNWKKGNRALRRARRRYRRRRYSRAISAANMAHTYFSRIKRRGPNVLHLKARASRQLNAARRLQLRKRDYMRKMRPEWLTSPGGRSKISVNRDRYFKANNAINRASKRFARRKYRRSIQASKNAIRYLNNIR